MGLKNPATGVYLRVVPESVNYGGKTCAIQRFRAKSNSRNMTEFDKAPVETIGIPDLVETERTGTATNNARSDAYEALKKLKRFESWVDDQP